MMGKRVLVYWAMAALILASSVFLPPRATKARQTQETRRRSVLVLHSYNVGYKWTDDITSGLMSVLGAEALAASAPGLGLDIQLEYMDTNRINTDSYLALLLDTYRLKFATRRFDAIVASDNNAFSFLLKYRDELFAGTPVVFCGVNYLDPAVLAGHDGFTGVNEAADVTRGLELALRLHPDTRFVAIVNDTTSTGQQMHPELKALEAKYKGQVAFLWYEAVDMADVENTLRVLPPHSIVFYTRFLVDKSGNFFEYDDSILRVVNSSQVPVYGTWDFSLGYGIVGGMLTSGFAQGEQAGQIVLRVLNGEPAGSIPVMMDSPNRYMFDYTALERWKIPLSSLPPGALVINRPEGFFEQYQGWLLGGGGVFLVLGLVIAVLARANRRSRRAEAALLASNQELEGIRGTLEARVEQRTAALDRRRDQLEAAAQVAREAAAIRDVNLLLDQAVRLISDRMGFYHAGIFLIDEASRYAVLRAASSEGGQQMLARGHRLPVGMRGLVGHVAASRTPRIALDVGQDAVFFDNPDLPHTRSEIALPLMAYGRVLGVLDVQSTEREAFGDEDVTVLQALADQVALSIDNARLLREAGDRVREISLLAGQQAQEGWRDFVAATALGPNAATLRWVYDGVDVAPAGPLAGGETGESTIEVPLNVQGHDVGRLQVTLAGRLPAPDEQELVAAVGTRLSLALERARLFQETQQRATSDRLVAAATARMRQTLSVESVLKAAVTEITGALGLAALDLKLEDKPRVLRPESSLEVGADEAQGDN